MTLLEEIGTWARIIKSGLQWWKLAPIILLGVVDGVLLFGVSGHAFLGGPAGAIAVVFPLILIATGVYRLGVRYVPLFSEPFGARGGAIVSVVSTVVAVPVGFISSSATGGYLFVFLLLSLLALFLTVLSNALSAAGDRIRSPHSD